MPSPVCRTIRRAIDFQTSGWLTVLPLTCHHFDLSPQQFRDALSLRYHTVQLDLNLMLASIVLAFKIARIACAQP